MTIKIFIFDAYGTLFDVAGAARLAAAVPGGQALAEIWHNLAENWRRKQLEYSWIRALTHQHADFARVTEDSLDWALCAAGLKDADLRSQLLALYDQLPPYPEVAKVLSELKAQGHRLAILSNGTPEMLQKACDAAQITAQFDALLSIEEAGIYKPDPRVYDLVEQYFAIPRHEVMFVSSNGLDISGASVYGFQSFWVNRLSAPIDRLAYGGVALGPDHIASDLSALLSLIPSIATQK